MVLPGTASAPGNPTNVHRGRSGRPSACHPPATLGAVPPARPSPRPSARLSPGAAARAVSGRLPPRLRSGLFRTLAPALRVRGSEHGLVTLVVVCQDLDLPRLPGTLASIAEDPYAFREVLMAPVGAATAAAARELVADRADPRLRLLAPARTWQEAVNGGAREARGRFLQLQRACDRRPGRPLFVLVETLDESGSDLALGRVLQRGRPETWLTRTTDAAHADGEGLRIAPADRPGLAGDLGLGDKMVVTERWRESGLHLDDGDGWLLSPTIARFLASARAVDVLDLPVQEHVPDHGTRPYGAMPSPLPELAAWRERAARIESTYAGTPLAGGWVRNVVDAALPGFLMDAERADEDQWAMLREVVGHYASAAEGLDPPPRADARALSWLATEDRRADLVALATELDALDGDLRTEVVGGEVEARWEAVPDAPPSVLRLAPRETELLAQVHRFGTEVELFVAVRHVDLGADAGVEVVVDGRAVPVVAAPDPAATRWAASRFHRALAVSFPAPTAPTTAEVRVTVAGLERSTTVELSSPHTRDPAADRRTVVRDLRLEGEDLVVTVDGPAALALVDADDRPLSTTTGGRLPLRLPSGFVRLVTPDGATPSVDEALVARLPLEQVGERHRLHATFGPYGGLLLHLGPPLTDDELGPWAQERLIEAYRADDRPVDPDTFYFETYAGRSATDNPRNIHDEIRRRRPHATTYWGVLDHAQTIPDGARPVLLRSRAWYDVLARAGCLVVNTDVEAWFRRRPGQVLLQTFHGYPSKGMGISQWEAAQLPPRQVRVLRHRGVDSWSAILTPTPEMTRHYREQYGYEGPALEHGYPRDDDLTAPDADEVRRRTRERLGIRPDQTAVLFAPTWREHLATRPRGAEMSDYLDVSEAAAALGPSHVLLVRGHRFHRPSPATAGVLDVTSYPEVNDLILAADVAVLDYSSLRFDFALTGKPMVFLVPDLADYAAGTRAFLFPYEDSAPGPFVDDTAGVVEQVRDVAALRARWSEAIAAFNATYHPWQDGHATERVVDGLLALLDRPTG